MEGEERDEGVGGGTRGRGEGEKGWSRGKQSVSYSRVPASRASRVASAMFIRKSILATPRSGPAAAADAATVRSVMYLEPRQGRGRTGLPGKAADGRLPCRETVERWEVGWSRRGQSQGRGSGSGSVGRQGL